MADTPLDAAHAAMEAAPGDDAARLRFYERLVEGEVILLLAAEPRGTVIEPKVFALEDGPVVAGFDREDRLAAFLDAPAPYAALPGRSAVTLLAQRGLGLGLNLGVAPSSILLPAAAVAWLAGVLGAEPQAVPVTPDAIGRPEGVPDGLLAALEGKLARMAGLARAAYLLGAAAGDGSRGHLLAFLDPAAGAERVLARAVAEAVVFSGLDAAALDVGFFAAADPVAARIARAGLRIDLAVPEAAAPPRADAPPRLR